jgi:methyl-accepting chemotaxis protein
MKYFRNLGIKQKFQLQFAISLFLICIFMCIYFPLKQNWELTNSLREKANVVVQLISKSSSSGMVYGDAQWTTTLFETLKSMPDVEFAILLNKDGTKFCAFNENKYEKYANKILGLKNNKQELFSDDNVEIVLYPILHYNDNVGTAVLAMNKTVVNSYISSSRITTIIISLLIFIIGLCGMRIFFNKFIYKPIKNLTSIADNISSGNVNIKIDSTKKDEIGQLERSFIAIVDTIKGHSEVAEMIAAGNLETSARVKSKDDILSLSINKVVDTLHRLIDEVSLLTKSATEGNLSARGDVLKYEGGYKELANGYNKTLDAVVNPIKDSSEVLTKLAQGDLTVRMNGSYKGDHQIIKDSINKLGDSLDKVIIDISETVHATASAAGQISTSSEEMAFGAQEQSCQTKEVAGAIGKMTRTIIETTRNSSIAAQAAKESGLTAIEGGKVVEQAIEGMNRIAEVVHKSAMTVQELGKSSDQIGEIVQVIDDIADQTNLLALNAAIEAARAGEQGRGFAVVADEVRKLAERTTKATKEIAGMIKQIQKDTEGAVESMSKGTEEVEKGKALADKASESLKEIIGGAEKVVDVITQVAAASKEQSATSEQISKNIEMINNVTQESAAGISQIAKASEDLNRLTVNLQELISRFKIDTSTDRNKGHKNSDGKSDYAVRSNGVIIKS